MPNDEEYRAFKVTPEVWDAFIESSVSPNIFATSSFLNSVGSNWSAWIAEGKSRPVLGATIQQQSGSFKPYRMYNGILATRSLQSDYFAARAAYSCLLSTILDNTSETSVSFSLHHRFSDIRPFKWWADESGSDLHVRPKYSGVIGCLQTKRYEDYSTALSARRRRDYRRAVRSKVHIAKSGEISILEKLHEHTLSRHGTSQSQHDRQLINRISTEVIEKGIGELLIAVSEEEVVLSAILWAYDRASGYILFWANHDEALKCGSSTLIVFEVMRRCREMGLHQLDLGGMNSFGRSVFKSSLGAVPAQYYELEILRSGQTSTRSNDSSAPGTP